MALPDRISYSSWQQFRNGCQWRWKLDVVDGLRSNNYGVYMDFGTAIHAAIEKYKTRKDPISLEASKKYFEEKFMSLFSSNKEKYREKDRQSDPKEFLNAGGRILDHLDRCVELKESTVLFNELELLLPMDRSDDVKMNFKGYIDMVIKSKDKKGKSILYIVDFKTCSWGWDVEKRQDRELQYQLFLYKHFLCKQFDLDPKEVRCAFCLLKRRPSGKSDAVEFFPVSAGPVSVQRALDNLNSDVTDMYVRDKESSFKKNRKICINEYGDTCPYYNTDRCKND